MTETPKRGGVVVKHGDALEFLPASLVLRIATCPPISRVPGARKPLLGITHTGGEIVPVVSMDPVVSTDGGPDAATLVVCRYMGESLGLLGCEVLATGHFDADPSAEGVVLFEGKTARALDLAATFATLQRARWALEWEG
jgi:chemotaxis signal transduction protein